LGIGDWGLGPIPIFILHLNYNFLKFNKYKKIKII